ncbi:MAG: hypothetical protein GXY13_12675 [Acidimicrobiales bacterium]|nr:hypothetical protein [Acidimicrobiales bacterium]
MYRLRDLDGRARPVAFAVFVLLAIPFALSLHRAADVGWIPSGDDAMIGMRAHGILDGHLPLVGQPSTSHLYGPDEGTAHPGPIEFYWLAGPVRLLGPTAGMLAATALVNLASVLAAAWIVLRRAGPGVALWASVLLAGVLWSEGTALLSDPISSNMGGLPLLALGAAAWAVVDGDHRLLPLATVVGSWVAQQHLAIVAPAAALVAWVLVGLVAPDVARVWTRWRSGEPAEAAGPGGGARGSRQPADGAPSSRGERRWPWLAASVVIAAVLWAPVAWQQLTGDRGNVSAVVDYARTSESPQLTAADAVRQGVRAMGYPPLLVRSDLNGFDLYPGPLRPVEIVVAALGYGALGATVVVWFRRRRTLSLLAATALVLAAGGVVNGSSVPASIEAYRINFYRWTFVVAWLGWTAIGWAAARLALAAAAGRGVRRWALPARRVLGGAAVVAMVAATLVNGFTAGVDDRRRDQEGFGAMRAVAAVAVDEAEGHDRVTLVVRGRSAVLASGSMLMLQLAAAGHDVRLVDGEERFLGAHRVFRPGDDPGDLVLLLTTARNELPDGPGRVAERHDINAEVNSLLREAVVDEGAPLIVAEDADRLLADRGHEAAVREYLAAAMATFEEDPAAVLTNPTLLDLVADGYFASPEFDPDVLADLADALPVATVNDDDLFELRVLTAEELLALRPDLDR